MLLERDALVGSAHIAHGWAVHVGQLKGAVVYHHAAPLAVQGTFAINSVYAPTITNVDMADKRRAFELHVLEARPCSNGAHACTVNFM